MDREKILRQLELHYSSKRDMISLIPLGTQPNALWEELLNRRRSKSIMLPLTSCKGTQYWYVTTKKMVAASEKIIEAMYEYETEFDPFADSIPVVTLEETFYTSFVEGSQISMQAAMEFLTSDCPPRDIEEQLITNNRLAGNYASQNLCQTIDLSLMRELSYILTDGMDFGGRDFRSGNLSDYTSLSGESFDFPPPHEIPARIDEITSFLSDPSIHPLIKSAVAQAWTILVRPFPEGNERLGRILSNMILLRAGYIFFSDVSLSALIARKSYGYYEAINNILRDENGGDLTYFIEYFMILLSRAVDERTLRQRKHEENDKNAETVIAKAALPQDQEETMTEAANRICPVSGRAPLEILNDYARNPGKVIGKFSLFLLNLINENTYRFCISDAANALQLDARQLSRSIRYLKDDGIIYKEGKRQGNIYYIISVNEIPEPEQVKRNLEAAEEQGISPDVYNLLQELIDSKKSTRNRRLGTMLALLLPKGQISFVDYREHGDAFKWGKDMALAMQLGLVEKIDHDNYVISKQLHPGLPTLSQQQKKMVTKMYECFGDNLFSAEMVVATLDYTGPNVSASLRQFTMMRILDCSSEDENKYRFLVNPRENPQIFDHVA